MDTEHDAEDQWKHRKERLVKNVLEINPDFLGIQEGLNHQVTYLDETLNQYKFIGVGRDDGIDSGEFCALFYDAGKWALVDQKTIWLSDTPNDVSMGWDAACRRVLTYGLFKSINGDTISVMNTHLDHQGKIARRESIELILNLAIDLVRYPIILMGDFNFKPDDPNYSRLTEYLTDSRTTSDQIIESYPGTFNGFRITGPFPNRIDYIFYRSERIEVSRYEVPDWRIMQRQVSDHFPVVIQFNLK